MCAQPLTHCSASVTVAPLLGTAARTSASGLTSAPTPTVKRHSPAGLPSTATRTTIVAQLRRRQQPPPLPSLRRGPRPLRRLVRKATICPATAHPCLRRLPRSEPCRCRPVLIFRGPTRWLVTTTTSNTCKTALYPFTFVLAARCRRLRLATTPCGQRLTPLAMGRHQPWSLASTSISLVRPALVGART